MASTHRKRQRNIKEAISIVKEGIKKLHLQTDRKFLLLLEKYLEQIVRFSRAYNLTGFKDPESLAERGVIDSLLYLEFIAGDSKTLLDIGSGAGFPGLIIKMARPALEVTLVEPSRKKAAFLEFVSNKLQISNVRVVQTTIEQLARPPEPYDVITTRALFKAEDLLKKVSPFIKTGTRLLLSKGPKALEEAKTLTDEGHYKIQLHKRKLPFSGIERYFLIIEKIA